MKTFSLRLCAFALGAVLFNWQPAMAGCGELCMGNYCESFPNQPSWGCQMSGGVCYDFKCWPARGGGGIGKELMEKIEKAVLAGDTHTVALLAGSVGQPFRIHDKDGVVYDGFALAGLAGPGASSAETQVAQGACSSSDAEASSAAEATVEETQSEATATAVTPQER